MTTNFPNSLDAYGTVPTNQQTAVAHRERHQDVEDAVEALQAKVGVDNSAVVTSLDYRVRTLEGNPGGAGLDASRVSYTPPFTGSVTRDGESRFADFVSVKDFGAVGNGLTDDTAAITAALAAYQHVFVPPGTYIVRNLTIPSNRLLYGAGPTSILKHPSIDLAGGSSTTIRVNVGENIHIRDLAIDGNKAGITNGDANNCEGFSCKFGKNVHISNILAYNCKSEAADFDDSEYCTASYVTAIDCGGMAVHLSENSTRCQTLNSTAIRCGIENVRPGFDTWSTSRGCAIASCVAIDCYRGFDCAGQFSTVTNVKVVNSKSWGFFVQGTDNALANITVDGASVDGALPTTRRGGVVVGSNHDIRDILISGLPTGQVLEVQASDSVFSGVSLVGNTASATVQTSSGAVRNIMRDLTINGGSVGVSVVAEYFTISGAVIRNTVGDGISVGAQYFNGTDINVHSPGSDGVEVSASNAKLTNVRVYSPTQAGFRVLSGCSGVSLNSCDAYTPGTVVLSNSGTSVEVNGGNAGVGYTSYTIASDAITVNRSDRLLRIAVDTEGGAATDNLSTINGGTDGQMVVIVAASNVRDVVVKHGTGNIRLNGSADFTLDANQDTITLAFRAGSSSWNQISSSNNAT